MSAVIRDAMAARGGLVVCLLAACAAPAPAPTMQPPDPPKTTAPASPAPRMTLAPNERLPLGGGVTVHFEGVTVESIEASPDGSYPGGSGITLMLIFEGMGAPVRREISLLSAGYESVREAWFERWRVEVVEVEDPSRKPRLVVTAEQVTERVRPGQPIAARLQRGAEIELGSTRMKFLGHSTKQIEAGEAPPLLVALEYQPFRAEAERFELHVGTEARPQGWSWRDYRFNVEAQAYDAWVQLSIARLELEPVRR